MYAKTFVGLVIGQVEKVISLQIDTELDSWAARYIGSPAIASKQWGDYRSFNTFTLQLKNQTLAYHL